MGRREKVSLRNNEYSPERLSAFLLQKIKRDSEAFLDETVTKAVATVPAYFDDNQRNATKDACSIAGIAVIDFGGGTSLFDPKKRAEYDARGFEGVAGFSRDDLFGGIDFEDLFGGGLNFDFGGHQHGDLFLRIRVHIPERLSTEERDLYQKLRDLAGEQHHSSSWWHL